MSSIFDELVALDRPWLPVKLKIGNGEKSFSIRRLNAADSDALDAFASDEYARLILEKTEPVGASELDRVRATYLQRPRHELLQQVVGTRFMDIERRALEIGGDDLRMRVDEAKGLTAEDQDAFEVALRLELDSYRVQARNEIGSEYDSKPDDELASIMAQVNINMKSIGEARQKQDARRLFYMLHDEAHERVFPTLASVSDLTEDTIKRLLEKIDEAFMLAIAADLPFVLQDGLAQSKPSPSPSTSVADTKPSGKRTRTRQKGSK